MSASPVFVPGAELAGAAAWAIEMHGDQVRKATGIPYVSHLFAVAALAMEHGADRDQTAAALLHDVVEDTPATFEQVQERFGPRVARIVAACSERHGDPKPEWRLRKEAYIDHVRLMPTEALVVTIADKLHNAQSIRRDLRAQGLSMFARFTAADPDDQLWYYGSLVEVYRSRTEGDGALTALVDELDGVVADIAGQVEALS